MAALALVAGWTLKNELLPNEWVERIYARVLFPPIRNALTACARLFPISLAELGLAVLSLWILFRCARGLAATRARTIGWSELLLGGLRQSLFAASVVYLLFLLTWGLNHARQPYAVSAGLAVRPSTEAELMAAARELVARANEIRAGIAEDERGVLRSRFDRDGFRAAVAQAFERAAATQELLSGPPPLLRFALGSRAMTAASIPGIYSPLTGEAHVDAEQLPIELGFNACHEVAHSRGFAREDEANYLAYFVATRAAEPELAYSGYLMALRHVTSALGGLKALGLLDGLRPGALRDWKALSEFWRPSGRMQQAVRVVSERINHAYLTSQGQALGTKSYGRMVDLLLAERRAKAGS